MLHIELAVKDGFLFAVAVGDQQARKPKKVAETKEIIPHMREKGYRYITCRTESELQIMSFEKPENDKDLLGLALRSHDWSYQMSDSLNTWNNGQAQVKEIRRLAKSVGEEAKAMIIAEADKHSGGSEYSYYWQ